MSKYPRRHPLTGKIRNANPKPPDLKAVDIVEEEPRAARNETNFAHLMNLRDGNRWRQPHRGRGDE